MPVVLVPRPKKVDGREVPIFEELGGRLFNPELEEDVEWLRQIHVSERARVQPKPRPGLIRRVLMFLGVRLVLELPTITSHRERWDRDFDEVLAHFSQDDARPVIQRMAREVLDEYEYLQKIEDFPEFPVEEIMDRIEVHTGEEPDQVLVKADLYRDGLTISRSTKQLLETVNQIEEAVDKHLQSGPDDAPMSLHFAKMCAEYFRFWGERGCSVEAQRFIETDHGRIRLLV